MGQYQHLTYRVITMVRGSVVSMVYKKASTLSVKDADPAASLTLMSADIERIVQGWQTIHDIWGNTLEIALAIFLLERELGVSCVVPVGVSLGKLELYLAPSLLLSVYTLGFKLALLFICVFNLSDNLLFTKWRSSDLSSRFLLLFRDRPCGLRLSRDVSQQQGRCLLQ